jgi:hypothetical protein
MSANLALPTQAGMPVFQTRGDACSFGNDAIALRWTVKDERFVDLSLIDFARDRTLPIIAPFAPGLAGGSAVGVAELRVVAPVNETVLAPNPRASRLAERIAGRRATAILVDAQGRLKVEWSVEQREGSRYLRVQLAVTALLQDEDITVVSLLETRAAGAHASSGLKGTPVIAGNFYLGFELPLAESHVDGDRVSFTLQRALPLEKNRTLVYSAVAGVVRDGQLRRTRKTRRWSALKPSAASCMERAACRSIHFCSTMAGTTLAAAGISARIFRTASFGCATLQHDTAPRPAYGCPRGVATERRNRNV